MRRQVVSLYVCLCLFFCLLDFLLAWEKQIRMTNLCTCSCGFLHRHGRRGFQDPQSNSNRHFYSLMNTAVSRNHLVSLGSSSPWVTEWIKKCRWVPFISHQKQLDAVWLGFFNFFFFLFLFLPFTSVFKNSATTVSSASPLVCHFTGLILVFADDQMSITHYLLLFLSSLPEEFAWLPFSFSTYCAVFKIHCPSLRGFVPCVHSCWLFFLAWAPSLRSWAHPTMCSIFPSSLSVFSLACLPPSNFKKINGNRECVATQAGPGPHL